MAMDKEMSLLLPLLQQQRAVTVNDTVFHLGAIDVHEIVAMKCGIGKVNAAIGTLTLIENFHPDLVINTGVAGGTGMTRVLDVVMASEVAYHDVWCGPGTTDGQAAGCPARFASPIDQQAFKSLCLQFEAMELPFELKRGLIASGDIFVSRKEDVQRITALYPDAVAVDMESAAIAHVCHLKNVPFICIRVISDTPGGEDNIAQYENFWDDAPRSTFEVLLAFLRTL